MGKGRKINGKGYVLAEDVIGRRYPIYDLDNIRAETDGLFGIPQPMQFPPSQISVAFNGNVKESRILRILEQYNYIKVFSDMRVEEQKTEGDRQLANLYVIRVNIDDQDTTLRDFNSKKCKNVVRYAELLAPKKLINLDLKAVEKALKRLK